MICMQDGGDLVQGTRYKLMTADSLVVNSPAPFTIENADTQALGLLIVRVRCVLMFLRQDSPSVRLLTVASATLAVAALQKPNGHLRAIHNRCP
jgi:hypothetical protein